MDLTFKMLSQIHLPLVLWEQVVLKTFALRTVACSLLASRPERVAYQDLASVCRVWRLIATRRVWFAATLRRLLATGELWIEWSADIC